MVNTSKREVAEREGESNVTLVIDRGVRQNTSVKRPTARSRLAGAHDF